MKRNATAEEFIAGHPRWRDTLVALRALFLSTELKETIKWGVPVYTLDGKNTAGLAAFKNHTAIWFFQGALLKDEHKKLVNAQEGVTKAQRQWRFDSLDQVDDALIRAYLAEAISNQKQGKIVKTRAKKTLSIPQELSIALRESEPLKSSFNDLSPYKQREYSEFITDAKQQATKTRRLEKIIPMILEGIGLNDKYRC